MKDYTVEDFRVSLPVTDYVTRFRDADRFMPFCCECTNYARSWACPPYNHDIDAELKMYNTANIIVTKITPISANVPIAKADEFISAERARIETQLLAEENTTGGRSFSYVGSCRHCDGKPCARLHGRPCLHPDKVRPSLEAYGFDVCRTTKELFNMDILWSTNGYIPEYLVLVTALFV